MKKAISTLLATLLCIALLVTTVGVGVLAEDPFDGYTAVTDAAGLKNIEKDLAGKYYLANDITITGSWEAIGWLDEDEPFTGIFNGNGKTVYGLTMPYGYSATYVGLFAINGGTIKNLTISGADINGGTGVGALAGVNKGIITNVCIKDSDVIGVTKNYSTTLRVGGLVGQNGTGGTITDCTVVNTYITGNDYIGGIAGSNLGTIKDCVADTVSINSNKKMKDIGTNGASNLLNYGMYVWSFIGGIAGNNQGTVTECAVTGDIAMYGFEYVGALIGYNSGSASKLFMGSENHDIPYYTPFNYGGYSFYAEFVTLDIGYDEGNGANVSDVYIIDNHSAHNFGEWYVVTPATCTEDGLKKRACTDCGFKETAVIPAAHTPGEWEVVTPATCTADGLKELRCTVCDALIDSKVITATGHTPGEWEVVTPATCTEDGLKELRCSVCDALIDSEVITATGHTPGEWNIATPATCTADGLKELRCTVCDALIDSEVITATGHTPGEWYIATPATCTADGLRELRCTVCDALIDSEVITATGHTPGEWTVVSPATCTADGLKELRCTVCDALIDSEVITAAGHTDADGDSICDNCGSEIERELHPGGIIDFIARFFARIFLLIFDSFSGIC